MKFAIKKNFAALCAGITLSALPSCDSSDLGSETPDKIDVNLALSGWDGGAGLVIQKKCASCHTSARSDSVPANTPHELDAMDSLAFYQKSENVGLIRAMRKRMESEDIKRQMPPQFATPLYADETSVVLEFLKQVESDLKPKPCSKTLADSSGLSLVSNLSGPCTATGDHKPSESNIPSTGTGTTNPPGPEAPIEFKDIKDIVVKSCGGCHNGVGNFALLTREDFVAKKPFPLEEISAASMPLNKPNWKDSEEGRKVLKWLNTDQTK